MSAVGVFGGTFDPIHLGHLITALVVKEIRNLSKIIFIPAYISPLKTGRIHSDAVHRLDMVKAATSQIPFFEYSDFEIRKGDISYTIDTLKMFKEKYSDLELIIGHDNIVLFESWKDPGEIFNLCKVIVLNRKSDPAGQRNKYFDKAVFVNTPNIEISASDIRERVKNNLSIDFFVTPEIKEYINHHKLYKDK